MNDSTSKKVSLNLNEMVLAYIVRTQGSGSFESLNRLRAYYEKHEGPLPDAALDHALLRGFDRFNQNRTHLFICNGRPCRSKRQMAFSSDPLNTGSCLTTLTECQGPCKQAPVATLRVDQGFQMFSQVSQPGHWNLIFEFSKTAAAHSSLEIDTTRVQRFLFDPEEDTPNPDVNLLAIDYPVGTFSGEGLYVDRSPGFFKTVSGTWEVGCRYISLSMEARYQTSEGKTDTHRALVLVGAGRRSNELTSWIFSDSGQVLQRNLELKDGELLFEDRVPGRLGTDARARKRLKPVPGGFLETLEVAQGTGDYEEYYNVHFKKHETGS